MMKIIKYLILPLKIILPIVAIGLLLYFRQAIFMPPVYQHVDKAEVYLEDRFQIQIPTYINKALEEKEPETIVVTEVVECPEVVEETAEADVVSESETDVTVVTEQSEEAVDTTPVAEQQTEDQQAIVQAEVEQVESTVSQPEPSVDMKIIENMSSTVDMINEKMDQIVTVVEEKVAALTADETAKQSAPVVEAPTQQAPTQAVEPKTVANASEDANSNLLHTARQAFWKGNIDAAEKLYLDLIDAEANNPDAYGELGNIYYTQGKWDKAGKAYYEAALIMLEQGNTQQVNYLLRVIQGLDAASAEKLKQKING